MKVKSLIFAVIAVVMAAVGCEMMENFGTPKIELDKKDLSFKAQGGSETFTIVATSTWEITSDGDWVTVDPEKGDASTEPVEVTVTVGKNDSGEKREAELTVAIANLEKTVKVVQDAASKDEQPGDEPGDNLSGIADVAGLEDGAEATVSGTIMARYARGFVLSDGTDNLLVYENDKPSDYAVGTKVTVVAVKATYGKHPQLQKVASIEKTDSVEVTYPEPAVYTAENFTSLVELTAPTYIQYTGVLNVTNGYYNVVVGEELALQGSIAYPDAALAEELSGMRGATLTITGYHIGTTGEDTFISTMVTAKELVGEIPEQPDLTKVIPATVEEFLAAEVGDQLYQLTGKIANLTNIEYGNFDLVDETGTVYVYGLTATKVDKNDKSFESLGLKEGDVVTMIGKRTEYKGEPQVGGPAYYVSHEEGDDNGNEDETEKVLVYYNDFDREEATKTYGSNGDSWPYLDQFDGWMNQVGKGVEKVTYSYAGMSARANSTSDSSYSDYEGSGSNNLFFGKDPYFAVNNIALNGHSNFELTFGSEKYEYDGEKIFLASEFHVYLSNDGQKWVELTDYTFAGGQAEGRWNVATANFTVPVGTEVLSICFAVDAESAYRMDDLMLAAVETAGTSVDFSNAVDKDFGSAGEGGGEDTVKDPIAATVAEFLAAEVDDQSYILTGTITNLVNTIYGNFDLVDETGSVYVYGLTATEVDKNDKSFESLGLREGDVVTMIGKRTEYKGEPQVGGPAYYVSHVEGEKPDLVETSLPDFFYLDEGTRVRMKGLVVAKYERGAVIRENGFEILAYGTEFSDIPVGSWTLITGTKSEYGGQHRIDQIESVEITGSVAVPYFEPQVYTAENVSDLFSFGSSSYVQYTGTLVENHNGENVYYNIVNEGTAIKVCVQYPDAELTSVLIGMIGQRITVKGYYVGRSSSKNNTTLVVTEYVNIMALSVELAIEENPGVIYDATASDIHAGADGTMYRMTGYVGDIKNALWGNYNLYDWTGSVYVYGTLNAAGESKKFEEMNIKAGDIVTVVGPKKTYNTVVELVDVTVEGHKPVSDIPVADFLNLADDAETYYRLTGTVTNLKDGDLYGNFDLVDESGSVYVYGVLGGWGGPKKQFQNLGVKNGDRITIVGVRSSYKGTAQVGSAFYVSHETPVGGGLGTEDFETGDEVEW